MSGKIEISRELAERLLNFTCNEEYDELCRILTAPVVELQPVAWRHTMHYEHGHGYRFELTGSSENPFGKPDIDYDKSFRVTCEPLYTEKPASVAVVLPERCVSNPREGYWSGHNDGWNEYDSELKRLNPWMIDKVKELNQ